jgi:DNA-binding transcriptional LysR family regulator
VQPAALKYFMGVVRYGTIRRAAEELHIAPSAISRQIANLESELGVTIFERHINGVVLTDAGQMLVDYASKAQSAIEGLRTAIDDLSSLRRGHVAIATVEAMTSNFLPQCLARFQKKYPGITANVIVLGSSAVAEAVLENKVDLGIAYDMPRRSALNIRARSSEPLHVVMAPTNPLACSERLSFAQVKSARIALPYASFGIRLLIDGLAKEAAAAVVPVLESNTLEMTKGLVRMSDTITFLPKSAVVREIATGALVAIPVTDAALTGTSIDVLTAAGRKLSRAAEAFLGDIREMFDQGLEARARHDSVGQKARSPKSRRVSGSEKRRAQA